MSIPKAAAIHPSPSVPAAEPRPEYANDVRIMAEPGGVQLTFTRPRGASDAAGAEAEVEVIARVVLPPPAARRLLRLLPRRLDLQRALAAAYDQATAAELTNDPFLAALAEAELDDEPYTDEDRAAVQAGREAFARGEFSTLDEVWRELIEDDDNSAAATS